MMSDEDKNLPDVTGGKSRGSLVHIDLSGLSEPGKLLVEKVSNGIGAAVRPFLAAPTAKAEVKAAAIRAEGQLHLDDIQRRGLERLAYEEGKRQQNMESVTAKAIPDLADGARPDKIEDDWIAHFFDRCRLISDEEAQTVWGKILSGEANQPGSFSRRTIDILSTMNRREAEQFSAVLKFTWMHEGIPYLIIHNHKAYVYRKFGMSYGVLRHLASIGLLQINHSSYHLYVQGPLQYFDKRVDINSSISPPFGGFALTFSGIELSEICQAEADYEYFDIIFDLWKKKGCEPTIIV